MNHNEMDKTKSPPKNVKSGLVIGGLPPKSKLCHHNFFRRTSKCGKNIEKGRCKKMGDFHAKIIQFSCCQQHLDVGATSQG